MILDIQQLSIREKQAWLQHAIAPRPIAFASTIDNNGNINLSPFSFFNLFSLQPAIIVFSPSRSGRTNTMKHSLLNIMEVPEVVINICDYAMVQQVSLSSCEYPRHADEFIKSGLTKEVATLVKPPMVKEAKVKFECKVNEVKSLGDNSGAGQLVIAEVLLMHVDESILNSEHNMIDQHKLKLVARLGGNYYSVVNDASLFEVAKPVAELGIGFDALPHAIRNSKVLTGNHLGQLANVHTLPEADVLFEDDQVKNIVQYYAIDPDEMELELHRYAAKLLDENRVTDAWQVLLFGSDDLNLV